MRHADQVLFIDQRLKFNGANDPAKFACCIFIFRPRVGELPPMGRFVSRTHRKGDAGWVSVQLRPSFERGA
jgi:hypothetical protein